MSYQNEVLKNYEKREISFLSYNTAKHILEDLDIPEIFYINFLKDYNYKSIDHEYKLADADIKIDNFNCYIGKKLYLGEFRDFFQNETEKVRVEEILRKYIDRLMNGLFSDNFKLLIKLGFSIAQYDQKEILDSLSYIADCYNEIISNELYDKIPIVDDFQQIADQVVNFKDYYGKNSLNFFDRHNLIDRMYASDRYKYMICRFDNEPAFSIQMFSQFFVDMYVITGNDIYTDLIKASYSLKKIYEYCDEKSRLLNEFWLNSLTLLLDHNYINLNYPKNYREKTDEENNLTIDDFDWDILIELGMRSHSIYVLKFIYVCKQEYEESGDEIYKKAVLQFLFQNSII